MRAALFIVLLLAGCLATPAPADRAAAAAMPWGVSDCAFVIAAVPVDEAALAARLPPGFALGPSPLSGLPAGPRATLELDAYACGDVRWNGSRAPGGYGSHYAFVEPPDGLREDGYDAYFVKWDALVADDAARAALVAEGFPAHAGDAQVSVDGRAVTASLGFDDGGGFSFTGVLSEEPVAAGGPLPFMEFTPLPDGALGVWHARLHDAAIGQGVGVVELPEGGWARELVGSPSAPATFIAGTWNVDEADVTRAGSPR